MFHVFMLWFGASNFCVNSKLKSNFHPSPCSKPFYFQPQIPFWFSFTSTQICIPIETPSPYIMQKKTHIKHSTLFSTIPPVFSQIELLTAHPLNPIIPHTRPIHCVIGSPPCAPRDLPTALPLRIGACPQSGVDRAFFPKVLNSHFIMSQKKAHEVSRVQKCMS